MNEILRNFGYKGQAVRTLEKDGAVWWILTDVCRVLGLSTPARVAERLDDDEKGVSLAHTLGGKQRMTIINESGLYSVLLRSDKPEAKPFKRWVTHEVLPSIRRTGQYIAPAEPAVREAEKKLVCDVPDNGKAQILLREMRDYTAAVQVLLNHYNVFRAEQERKAWAAAIGEVCGRLYSKSIDLDRVKYNMVEKK